MRLATLAGLYVAVVLSAQIGAQKFIPETATNSSRKTCHASRPEPGSDVLGRRFLPAKQGDIVTV